MASTTAPETTEWILKPEQEFRFEVDMKSTITVKVTEGTAELFGTELALNVDYQFTGRSLAIFSWHGCTLITSGKTISEYIGEETPMQQHINVHFALENLRKKAKENDLVGPRVMVVGPREVGKTSLVRTLVSYAARSFSHVFMCDIDPNGTLISLPGTISAMTLHTPIDPEEEFSATISLYKTSSISYYFGGSIISEKKKLYTSLVSRLATVVNTKLNSQQLKHNGVIIDTSSQLVDTSDIEALSDAIEKFAVNVILVIGHERLLIDLQRRYPTGDISILKISKSGGVINKDKNTIRQLQQRRIKEYFYGTLKNDLTPFSQTVSFSDLVVRRAKEGSLAPSSTLPLGMTANPHEINFVKVEVGDILLHSVLAVTFVPLAGTDPTGKLKIYTPEEESELLLKTNICGFIYVSEVNSERRKLTILAPSPGHLPKMYLIMGALAWLDS